MKKVLLVVVDALASRVVIPALKNGELPQLQRLRDAGTLRDNCTSVFPSITPAALTAIVTGQYPVESGIPGAYWYDPDTDKVNFYAGDFQVVLRQGYDNFFQDFLVRLNHDRIQAKTLFQKLEENGHPSACLNYFVYRGDVEHKLNVPLLLRILPGMPYAETVEGPSTLYLGDFVTAHPTDKLEKLDGPGGLFNRYGFQDDTTGTVLVEMAEARSLPDFTLAYFPDNDWESHEVGPQKALTVVQGVDTWLGRFFDAYGGLEAVLDDFVVIVTGDHSQSDIVDGEESTIDMNALLDGFSVVDAGTEWSGEDLVVCPNLRTTQIYLHAPSANMVNAITGQLLTDPRIDQVIWRDDVVNPGGRGYHVATSDKGMLHFWKTGGASDGARDVFGGEWGWHGDLEAVSGVRDGDRILHTLYPHAFERIACGLDLPDSGHMWVTARPGHDMILPAMDNHPGGGSHGSLHILDSTAPLFVAGAPEGVSVPEYPRLVDVAPLILQCLEVESPLKPGMSRV